MKRYEVEHIVECYFDKEKVIEDNNRPSYAYNSRDKLFKSYKTSRARRIESFYCDALSFKDIECDEDNMHYEFNFKASSHLQYSLLEKNQLIAYFSFRTSLRNGILPRNNYIAFLNLYLMEILHGIVDDSFDDKFSLLMIVAEIYSNERVLFKNRIKTAFELLYVMHNEEIDKFSYFEEVPLSIFMSTSVSFDYDFSYDNKVPVFSIIAKGCGIDIRNDRLLHMLDYSGDCIKFVYLELQKENNFDFAEYNSIDELFHFTRVSQIDVANNGLKVLFPITLDFLYYNATGDEVLFKNGVCSHTELSYCDKQKDLIEIFIQAVGVCQEEYNSLTNDSKIGFDLFLSEMKERNYVLERNLRLNKVDKDVIKNMYNLIIVAVGHWIKAGDKIAKPNINNHYNKFYKLDMNDVDVVRDKSRDIQEKLIIEEKEEVKEEDNNIQSIPTTSSKDTEPLNEVTMECGTFESFISSLSQCEKDVLTALFSNDITKAESIAFKEGLPLSIVLDNINSISDALLDDIVIEANTVIDDYRDDIERVLKK